MGRQDPFLDHLHRREPDLLPAALLGSAGHAASLHRLPGRLRGLEFGFLPGCLPVLRFDAVLRRDDDLGAHFGASVASNYWGEGATTLEWTVSSPPPFHTFDKLPQIK